MFVHTLWDVIFTDCVQQEAKRKYHVGTVYWLAVNLQRELHVATDPTDHHRDPKKNGKELGDCEML